MVNKQVLALARKNNNNKEVYSDLVLSGKLELPM